MLPIPPLKLSASTASRSALWRGEKFSPSIRKSRQVPNLETSNTLIIGWECAGCALCAEAVPVVVYRPSKIARNERTLATPTLLKKVNRRICFFSLSENQRDKYTLQRGFQGLTMGIEEVTPSRGGIECIAQKFIQM